METLAGVDVGTPELDDPEIGRSRDRLRDDRQGKERSMKPDGTGEHDREVVTWWTLNNRNNGLLQYRATWYEDELAHVVFNEASDRHNRRALPFVRQWYITMRYVPTDLTFRGQGRSGAIMLTPDHHFATFDLARAHLVRSLNTTIIERKSAVESAEKLVEFFTDYQEPSA